MSSNIQINQEIHLKVLRYLQDNPDATQRDMAKLLGISLGKVNYCIKALIDKGLVKTRNFNNNKNKRTYLYILTPKGIETKSGLTISFLKRKIQEYELLRNEIDNLQKEINKTDEIKITEE